VDQHADVAVRVDRRHLVVVRQVTPAGVGEELWTIAVNARSVPHRVFPGEIPHAVSTITRSVWRYRNRVTVEPCDTLGCGGSATVATWHHRSLCPRCAHQLVTAGR
jgi:predicted Zn-ribbon and HTH transcriptional regulator